MGSVHDPPSASLPTFQRPTILCLFNLQRDISSCIVVSKPMRLELVQLGKCDHMNVFREALEFHYQHGLDRRYDDVLEVEDAVGADLEAISHAVSFDYTAQVWRDGSDHAHFSSGDADLPLIYCGKDRETCYGGADEVTA